MASPTRLNQRMFLVPNDGDYNDIVLVNAVGTGAMRMYGNFDRGARKVKTHQNALVFVKGDPKKAAARIVGGE